MCEDFIGKKSLMLALLLLCAPLALQARQPNGLPPGKQLAQFILDHWDERNGLPYNTFNHIEQSADGFLWLSTFDGLLRFDGKLFDAYTQATDTALTSNGFYQMAQGKDGRIWLATQGSGLAYFTPQGIQIATSGFQKAISALAIDAQGNPWLGTINEGAYYWNGSGLRTIDCPVTQDVAIRDIFFDRKGNAWLATEGKGVAVIDKSGGCNAIYGEESGLPNARTTALAQSPKGVWVGTTGGLALLSNGKAQAIQAFSGINITDLLLDGHGVLWIATTKGLARMLPNGEVSWLDGIESANIESICLDMENSLWLATKGSGLYRIRNGKFLNYSSALGLSNPVITCAFEWGEDSLLLGSEKGTIDLVSKGIATPLLLPNKHSNAPIKNIYEDLSGNLWIATYGGLFKRTPRGEYSFFGKETGLPENRMRGICPSFDGNLWVGTRSSGIMKIDSGGKLLQHITIDEGLGANYIMCMATALNGDLLVATNGGGLNLLSKDGRISVYKDKAGFKGTIIFGIYPDKDGKVWVAANSGLCYLKEGKFVNFTRKGGLPSHTPFDVKEDGQGNLWMPSSDGVMVVPKAKLLAYEAGEIGELPYQVYDHSDGLVSKECTGATNALQMRNGLMAFPNIKGLSIINPSEIPLNRVPPAVVIKRMQADNQALFASEKIEIAPGAKRFTFDFAALSFISPPKVLFKYMLEGVDPDWIDAGNARSASYTNLSPGTYTFKVIACNNDGYWNNAGASVTFELQPYFYQRPIASAIGLALFFAAVYGIYQTRVRAIQRQKEALERIVSERTAEINQQKEEIQAQRDKISEAFEKIQTVSDIGREVTSVIKVSQLAPIVHQHVKKLMPAESFGIGVYTPHDSRLNFIGFIEAGSVLAPHSESVLDNHSLASQCFNKQEMIWINDFDKEFGAYFAVQPPPRFGQDTQSIIFIPLIIENRPIGVLTVQSFEKNAYLPEHLTFLLALASYVAVALDNANAYEQIASKNQSITDSLRYAQTIQDALLPARERLEATFADYFVMYRPKDIVSGDFYWMAKVDGILFVAVVDCTGHGVPGAFMGMIGNELLNEIVGVERILSPGKILEELHIRVVKSLRQDENKNSDGMDIALCALSREGKQWKMVFAGAKRPILYSQNGEIKQLRPDRHHIGGLFTKEVKVNTFQNQEVLLDEGDCIYLMTDGMADQAAPDRKKIGTGTITNLLKQHLDKSMQFQHAVLSSFLEDHQQDAIQRDDITILGIRL